VLQQRADAAMNHDLALFELGELVQRWLTPDVRK
jgi:hypothetical protein